ncbi:DoxX family protein [Amycolatopsis taiwanensis]|uniref:DoxX family protein n=1 Tax=Amycolatopsis taiwanensis TaxID=342230 RepID=UPI0004ADEDBA|nr:MauE/DoxX family redox-associated membrane protein [Amycolatopsis taiwanensis]
MHTIASIALAIFFLVTGVTHFLFPGYYRALVPVWLPGARVLVVLSGVAEIVVAGLVAVPATRALGGWLGAALITAFLTVWIEALRHARSDQPCRANRLVGVVVRLVVNIGYVAWAIAVAV